MTVEEVIGLVNRFASTLKYNRNYAPVFLEGRNDVCAVVRLIESDLSHGRYIVYLLWKDSYGQINWQRIKDTDDSEHFVYVEKITAKGNEVTVHIRKQIYFCGRPIFAHYWIKRSI